jgi:hypothetical protein
MSYCRWSSDDYQCDVYVYEDVGGGWTTWVAGRTRRLREGVSFPPPVDSESDFAGWFERMRAVGRMVDSDHEGLLWDWVDLPDLPEGDHFNDATPGECADRLEWLRERGFSVPQYAIDALREESAAQQGADQ